MQPRKASLVHAGEKLRARAEAALLELPALALALKDRETPPRAKILAALCIAYALSPVDLIPDFIPVLGLVDDALVLPALAAAALRSIPPAVLERARHTAAGRAKLRGRWYYALPALMFWAAVAVLIYLRFRH